MAKFEKNKNESPEIDLKNLTVRLAGMGMEKEAEEMADTRKKNYSTVEDEETEVDDESSTNEDEISDNEEEIIEDIEDESSESEEVSDEVEEFYEKRAKERNLTLEKVEELANEMEEASDEDAKKVVKLSKVKSESALPEQKKKKAHIDAVTILGIFIALAVLAGGIYYLMLSLRKSPNLGLTQKEYTNAYHDSVQFKQVLSNYGSTMVEPKYRTEVEDDVKSRTFDLTIDNSLGLPVYMTGIENKDTNKLVRLRFAITFSNPEALNSAEIIMVSFLQALYPDRDSTVCFGNITSALDLTNASTKDAVAVKDGKIAYALTLRTLDGKSTLIMDVIPESSADNYSFTDSL